MINHAMVICSDLSPPVSSADLDPISGNFLLLFVSVIFMLGCKMRIACVI